jgi:uncharacterized SAM-binding protein YcdF (DUF218 family)
MKVRKGYVILFIVVMLLLLSCTGFYYAGQWLRGNEQPIKSNAILVLAGQPSRALYAAELYKNGYALKIYISRPVREQGFKLLDELGIPFPKMEDIYREVLLKKGVLAEHIHFFGTASLSTVEEAEEAKKVFSSENCKLIVVTSPFHVRRTQMIFRSTLKDCKLNVVGTPYEPYPDKWWSNQDSARNIFLEVGKIIFYLMGGRFRT